MSLGAGCDADDMVSLRSSRLSVKTSAAKGGSISVSADNGTIDVRRTTFSTVTPQLTATKIITRRSTGDPAGTASAADRHGVPRLHDIA